MYKEDLQEFGKIIVSDTSAVIKDRVDKLSEHKAPISSRTHLQARFLRVQRDPKTCPLFIYLFIFSLLLFLFSQHYFLVNITIIISFLQYLFSCDVHVATLKSQQTKKSMIHGQPSSTWGHQRILRL